MKFWFLKEKYYGSFVFICLSNVNENCYFIFFNLKNENIYSKVVRTIEIEISRQKRRRKSTDEI